MGMKGDFLSFSFAGLDSSKLNIVRTSDGDRFDEQIVPEIKDVTVEVPGMDGEYFFGSTYGPRSIDISFAFDSLTEEQFRRLRKVYGRRRIGELILSERPYKRYMVKIESPIELSYICFDEPKKVVGASRDGLRVVNRTPITEEIDGEEQVVGYSIEREQVTPYEYQGGTERIYKGEGKVTFIAYFPFAKSNFKVLPELGNEYYEGRDDWAVSSGILSQEERNKDKIDTYQIVEGTGAINVYNAGDVPTGFRLYVPASAMGSAITLFYEGAQLKLKPMVAKTYETIYQEVSEPSGNPAEQSWYEYKNARYTLSTDTEVDENKTYYTKTENKDSGVIIDTNTGLINGIKPSTATVEQIDENTGEIIKIKETDVPLHIDYNGNVSYTTSGNIYNECVESGYFFKLQPDDYNTFSTLQIEGGNGFQIFYDYLYF